MIHIGYSMSVLLLFHQLYLQVSNIIRLKRLNF
jgi:hypothetical protein